MNDVRDAEEARLGLHFIGWYNRKHRRRYLLTRRTSSDRLLLFLERDNILRARVWILFYDAPDAAFRWVGESHNPHPRCAVRYAQDFHLTLAACINDKLSEQCSMLCDANTVLLISVLPTVTTPAAMREILKDLQVPKTHAFAGIYLLAHLDGTRKKNGSNLDVEQLA